MVGFRVKSLSGHIPRSLLRASGLLPCYPNTPQLAAGIFIFKRYHYQGIGRFEPEQAYARGIADLDALAELLPPSGFLFGAAPCSADTGLYGFLANILFYPIETPLKAHLATRAGLVTHCQALHALVGG